MNMEHLQDLTLNKLNRINISKVDDNSLFKYLMLRNIYIKSEQENKVEDNVSFNSIEEGEELWLDSCFDELEEDNYEEEEISEESFVILNQLNDANEDNDQDLIYQAKPMECIPYFNLNTTLYSCEDLLF
ncbi:hypothetical protein K502DRAFT_191970 [Neoconidiobolus thromboides FSU 785]|nr:hypothetical protein K502DRAFT_191970 [Neoconidiobolus thromboides FSU 785]